MDPDTTFYSWSNLRLHLHTAFVQLSILSCLSTNPLSDLGPWLCCAVFPRIAVLWPRLRISKLQYCRSHHNLLFSSLVLPPVRSPQSGLLPLTCNPTLLRSTTSTDPQLRCGSIGPISPQSGFSSSSSSKRPTSRLHPFLPSQSTSCRARPQELRLAPSRCCAAGRRTALAFSALVLSRIEHRACSVVGIAMCSYVYGRVAAG